MLSLNKGVHIANLQLNEDGKKPQIRKLFLEDDEDGDKLPNIFTTKDNLVQIFKKKLELNKKLSFNDIEELTKSYQNDDLIYKLNNEGKLSRVYSETKRYADNSTKHYLDFGKDETVMPCFPEPSVRVFVSGLSGSGKSTMIQNLILNNPPKGDGFVFLFSPIEEDQSLSKIKKLIHLDFSDFERENEKEFEFEDIPAGSICIFDDYQTAPKHLLPLYQELLDKIMERGRHNSISCYVVSHNPLAGAKTKVSIRESTYMLVFPRSNPRDVRVLLKTYCGFNDHEIDQIMNIRSRWALVKKTVPRYTFGEHQAIVY